MEEARDSKLKAVYPVLIFLLSVILSAGAGYLYGLSVITLVRNGIFVSLLSGITIFTLYFEFLKGRLLYDNAGNMWRFFLTFVLSLIAALFFPLIPSGGWIYLSVFVALTLFSDELIAFTAGTELLSISLLLTDSADITAFFAYIIPGITAIVLFSTISGDFKVFVPILVSSLSYLTSLSVAEVLVVNRIFTITAFLYPVVNTVVCIVIMLIVLKLFSFSLIYKEQDRLMDIIDTEFELLTMLKSTSKTDYDHSIYTAVLCSKMANKLGLSEPLTKALGYYHRIGVVRGENNWENAESVMREYEIPENVIELLSEYLDNNRYVKSKETSVLLFADTVISSIDYLFSKDKDAALNYDKLIVAIFDKKIESGVIDRADISYGDINIMKKTLIDEKLFYDFLR